MINIGKIVRDARKARGLKQYELARRADMSAAQLSQLEKGRMGPTFATVERIAVALDTDIPGLLGAVSSVSTESAEPHPVVCDAGAYYPMRTQEADAPKVLKQILPRERELDAWAQERGVATGCTIALNRAAPAYAGAGAVLAEELRTDLGLGTAPLGDLETVLRFRGVRIHRARLAQECGSVSFWNETAKTPVIVLNARTTVERQRYRLVYELATACLYASRGGKSLSETLQQHRFLTDFTAAFLMPATTVRAFVAASGLGVDDWTFDALVALKTHFTVSAESFALRLEELGLIAPALRLELRDRLRAYYKSHPKSMEPQVKGKVGT